MKAFFKTRQHSKSSSITSHSIVESTEREAFIPATPTEWWLARENAFDTANRVYKKLYRPDSEISYYSREQDYDEEEEEEMRALAPLSPSSPEWNASRWFWSVDRSQMWVEHVVSSGWSAVNMGDEARDDADGGTVITANDSQDKQENEAEIKSTAAKLPRRPKLTIQIPSGTPDYYANHGPNDYSSCRPQITSEERAEWKKNMF